MHKRYYHQLEWPQCLSIEPRHISAEAERVIWSGSFTVTVTEERSPSQPDDEISET